jgi:hypothetical protein
MFGRMSLLLPIISYDLDLERIPRRHRSEQNSLRKARSKTPMAEGQKPVLLRDHYVPTTYTPFSSLKLPDITAALYEIKPSIIQMLPSFYGLDNEDPYKHLDEFLEICLTMRLQNISEDALRMRLFPFSLKDKAKYWLNSLETNSITY